MVDADVVEVMIALPGQLFFNTQIPACLWFLAKQKKRKGEVIFIDARKQATMISRVQSELTDEVIERISQTVAAWRESSHPMLRVPVSNRRIADKQEKGLRPSLSCALKADRNEGRPSPP